jgi:uncharacterized protein
MQLSDLQPLETRQPKLLVSLLVLGGLFMLLSGIVNILALYLFIPKEYQDMNSLLNALSGTSSVPGLNNRLLIWQGFTAIAGFIVAPMVYLFVLDKPLLYKTRQMQTWTNWSIPATVILALAIQPIIDFTYHINQGITLPDSLAQLETFFKDSEAQMQVLTKALAMPQDLQGWLLAIMVIGIIPAIGEELLFRGVLQPLLIRAKINPHISIWTTAILFSLLHMQMYGFIPRAIMGALFGYIYFYSGILPLAIIGHAANNLMVLIIVNLTGDIDNTNSNSWFLSILVLPVIYYGFKKLMPPNADFKKKVQEGWAMVYITSMNHRAELVASILEKSGLAAMVINKVDSSFHFGEFQVFVHSHQEHSAKTIIANAVSFE